MGDIQFVDMPVEEVTSDNGRTVIKSGGQMFSFFQTKKDGQPSRAQSDFEKLGVAVGNNYSFGITENVKQTPEGGIITFKNICLISESRGGNNNSAPAQPAPPEQSAPDPQVPSF